MCKIVIVDDVKSIREELKNYLERTFPEHEVYDFAGTKGALKKVKEFDFIEIIVFNSLKNKKPNGIEFAKVCRQKSPVTMLIYTTGKARNYEHMQQLACIGIDSYLYKPLDLRILDFMIINSLNRIKSLQTYKTEDHKELEIAVNNLIRKYNISMISELKKVKKSFWALW